MATPSAPLGRRLPTNGILRSSLSLTRSDTGGMNKLHLGAYHIVHKGWINTDVTWQIWVARVSGLATLLRSLKLISPAAFNYHRQGLFRQIHYLNVVKRFPFGDNSFEYVYSAATTVRTSQ